VDDLATHFHQPRAAVLSSIMAWGLSQGQTSPLDQGDAQGPMRHLYCYVTTDLQAHVKRAAPAAGLNTAPWLRQMVRQIALTDFPASWQEARAEDRSHDSRTYGTRFMLRLDHLPQEKLEALSAHFAMPAAEIIGQLIGQAKPEDFPPSWQMRDTERSTRQARPQGRRPWRTH
jgi:hypothetical protein